VNPDFELLKKREFFPQLLQKIREESKVILPGRYFDIMGFR
jgi:hypothetical protein